VAARAERRIQATAEAKVFVGLGVRAGCSDLLFWHGGKSFALELKTEPGRATKTQRAFLRDFEIAGGHAACAAGLDSALRQLEQWGLLRGVTQ